MCTVLGFKLAILMYEILMQTGRVYSVKTMYQ